MKLVNRSFKSGHLSIIAVPNFQLKPTTSKSNFKDADEIDYRWLWFAVRIERYKELGAELQTSSVNPRLRSGCAGTAAPRKSL